MKKINNLLIILSIIIGVTYLIISGNYILTQILLCLGLIPILLIPKILRYIFKSINISNGLELTYIIFIIMTMLFGSLMGGFSMISWYDSFTHFLSGMLSFVVGISLLVWLKKYKQDSIAYNILFAIMLTLSVAVLWECCEFTIDLIFKTDTQKVITTGVTDTMKDMICALLGAILLAIPYYYSKDTKNNFWTKLVKNSK